MKCPKCNTEFEGESCPNCQNAVESGKKPKKPIYKKWWFWVLVGGVAICVFGAFSGSEETPTPTETTQADDTANTVGTASNLLKYEEVSLSGIYDELEANALKAKSTYQDKYVVFDAEISSIDNDGKYIMIMGTKHNEYRTVICYIQEGHIDFLMNKKAGDIIRIIGQITDVGEFVGYEIEAIDIRDKVVKK